MFTRPDNSVYPSDVLSSDIDNAELAARLSTIRFRRNGRVIFYDDFHSGLAWSYNPSSMVGIFTQYAQDKSITPPGLLHLIGASGVDSQASVELPSLALNKIGIEITFKLDSNWLPNIVDYMSIKIFGGSFIAGIRLDTSIPEIEILDDTNTWKSVSNFIPNTNPSGWHNLKFILDVNSMLYGRLFYDRQSILINELCYSTGGLGGSYSVALAVNDTDANPTGVSFDNIIITTDESVR